MSARADRNPHTAWVLLGREIGDTGALDHDPQAVRARLNGCDLAGNHDRSGAFVDHRRRNRLGAPLADAKTERRRGEHNAGEAHAGTSPTARGQNCRPNPRRRFQIRCEIECDADAHRHRQPQEPALPFRQKRFHQDRGQPLHNAPKFTPAERIGPPPARRHTTGHETAHGGETT